MKLRAQVEGWLVEARQERMHRQLSGSGDLFWHGKERGLEDVLEALDTEVLVEVGGWCEAPKNGQWRAWTLHKLTEGKSWGAQMPVTVTVSKRGKSDAD